MNYLRANEELVRGTFRGYLAHVEGDGTLHIREAVLQHAYRQTRTLLASLLSADEAPVMRRVCRHDVYRFKQCIVVYSGGIHPERGEIIHADAEGYADVLLVDSGERIFAERRRLYHTIPLLAMTAALQLPCRLYGGYDEHIGNIAEILSDLCGTGPVAMTVRAREPLLISIHTEMHGDIGDYLNRLAEASRPPLPRPLSPVLPRRSRRRRTPRDVRCCGR